MMSSHSSSPFVKRRRWQVTLTFRPCQGNRDTRGRSRHSVSSAPLRGTMQCLPVTIALSVASLSPPRRRAASTLSPFRPQPARRAEGDPRGPAHSPRARRRAPTLGLPSRCARVESRTQTERLQQLGRGDRRSAWTSIPLSPQREAQTLLDSGATRAGRGCV